MRIQGVFSTHRLHPRASWSHQRRGKPLAAREDRRRHRPAHGVAFAGWRLPQLRSRGQCSDWTGAVRPGTGWPDTARCGRLTNCGALPRTARASLIRLPPHILVVHQYYNKRVRSPTNSLMRCDRSGRSMPHPASASTPVPGHLDEPSAARLWARPPVEGLLAELHRDSTKKGQRVSQAQRPRSHAAPPPRRTGPKDVHFSAP